MNVLVDIDDTLADLTRPMLTHVNQRLSRRYRYEDLTREFREAAPEPYQSAVNDFLNEPRNSRVAPFDDAVNGLRRLHEAGYAVHIVSSRRENLHETTREWLAEHGFADYVAEIHPRYSAQKGVDFKRAVARRIKPVAAFDDTHNVAMALAPWCVRVYLIDHPWNADDRLPDNVHRVPDFARAVDRFLSD